MFSNIGPVQLLIVLLIVLAIFGTKKLRSLGSDLGGAVKGFRSAVADADKDEDDDSSGKIGKQSSEAADADFDNTPAEETRKEKNNR